MSDKKKEEKKEESSKKIIAIPKVKPEHRVKISLHSVKKTKDDKKKGNE